MKAIDMRCPNCMGTVVPFGNGTYGRCESCGATFKLRDDDDADTEEYDEDDYEDDEEEDDDDEEGFDFDEFFHDAYNDYVDSPGLLVDAYFGPRLDENPNKIQQAIDNLGVDEDEDDVYFVLDSTIFGSCKKGLACTSEGVYIVDSDGDSGFLDWEDFDEQRLSRDGGTFYLGGYPFIMSEAEARIVLRVMRDLQKQG